VEADVEKKSTEQTVGHLIDEAGHDETMADIRELHRGTLALMHQLHAEKMRAFDRLEERLRETGRLPTARTLRRQRA
jgi:hypothetical protein